MRTILGVSWVVALAALALAGEAQPINQTVVVNDIKVTLKRKRAAGPLFEIADVTVYEAVAAGTGERCTVIAGYLISHLPSHSYDVDVKLDVSDVTTVPGEPGCLLTWGTFTASIHCPVPNKRTRFVMLGRQTTAAPSPPAAAYSFHVTYKPRSALDGDKSGK